MDTCRTQEGNLFSASNIRKCEEYVISMQRRLDKAVANNDKDKIRSIFNILAKRSFAVRVLAIWRITYRNYGRNTAGIDGVAIPKNAKRVETDAIRHKLLERIDINAKPKAVKRVYIPKANGKQRPLGIPSIQDRVIQEIIRIALEPIVEYHSHDNSFGFRPKRSCHDAQEALFKYLSSSNRKRYVLEGDIKGAFDHISHQHILNTLRHWKIPKYAVRTIATMLKSDISDKGRISKSTEGTPQGGVLSPMLANVALNSFDCYIAELFGKTTYHGGKHKISPMIRYADDFVIVCKSKTEAKQMKEWITHYLLSDIGLTLSDEKTKIVHIKKGFDFLGFNFKKYPKKHNPTDISDYKLLIKPQKDKVTNLLQNCKETIDNNKQIQQDKLIRILNPKIRGWGNYYKHIVSSQTFSKLDYFIWVKLLHWAKRRHSNKSKRWVLNRYFVKKGKSFHFQVEKETITNLSKIPIRRHIKVKQGKRVYNQNDISYWEKREEQLMEVRLFHKHKTLYKKQKGLCPECDTPLLFEDNLHIHHVKPKAQGGSNSHSNLKLIHAECHREIHSGIRGGAVKGNSR